ELELPPPATRPRHNARRAPALCGRDAYSLAECRLRSAESGRRAAGAAAGMGIEGLGEVLPARGIHGI
ncbi:MAG: hypothetical protein AVDCRST_MAG88-3016, partial [uncultured Thermomicrobiales bacterium]